VAAMVYSRQDQNGGSSRQLAIVALTWWCLLLFVF
jgi:hypothetical protein